MRRLFLCLLVIVSVRCAGFSDNPNGSIQFESINRHTVLVRFTSSPEGAAANIACGSENRRVVTPGTARLPIDVGCTVTFAKYGYQNETAEFQPADFAHPSALSEDPTCNSRGVWCTDADSLGQIIFGSIFFGTSGLLARAFDGVRKGRGEVGAVLLPIPIDDGDVSVDSGSDSAPPGG